MHPIISLNSSKTRELCHPLAGNYASLFTKSAILFALPQFLSLPNTLATNPQQFFFINWNLKFYFLVWTQFLSDLWTVIGCPKFWLCGKIGWVTWGAWSSEHFLFTPCFRVLECFVIFVNQPFQCFEILSLLDIELLSTLLFMRNSLSKYFVIVKGHLILYTFNNLQRCMLNFSYLYFFQILAY